jgi:hypothetical protein
MLDSVEGFECNFALEFRVQIAVDDSGDHVLVVVLTYIGVCWTSRAVVIEAENEIAASVIGDRGKMPCDARARDGADLSFRSIQDLSSSHSRSTGFSIKSCNSVTALVYIVRLSTMHVHLAAPMALSRAGRYWRGPISLMHSIPIAVRQ